MKQSLLAWSLLALLLFGAFALAETPQWIQSSERLVGENSTQYEDTLNRAGKTIWNTFLVEHGSSGLHNYSTLATHLAIPASTDDLTEGVNLFYTDTRVSAQSDVAANSEHRNATGNPHGLTRQDLDAASQSSVDALQGEWALSGNGSGVLAQISGVDVSGVFDTYEVQMWAVVIPHTFPPTGSIFKRVQDSSGNIILDFGLSVTDGLYLEIGDASLGTVSRFTQAILPSMVVGIPIFVGVEYDPDDNEHVFFMARNSAYASSGASDYFSTGNGAETVTIGSGFDGEILTLCVQSGVYYTPSSKMTPYHEGLSQCINPLVHYEMDEREGSTLNDSAGNLDLTVSGAWTQHLRGY